MVKKPTDISDALDQWLAGEADDELLLRAADDVQMVASLRFDGYRYCRDFLRLQNDYSTWTERWEILFRESDQLPADDNEAMALAFILQRYLGKWGGEYQPPHGLMHRLWRASVLRTIHLPTPAQWWPREIDPECAQRWDRRFRPRLDAAQRCVRQVHERMRYDDEATFALEGWDLSTLLRPKGA